MIIRPAPNTLLFITQPDHARLAADLLGRWTADRFPENPRRAEILLAAREHDNGWQELDASLVFDAQSGRALDFIDAPEPIKQSVWPRGVDRLAHTSAYAAALVAQHAIFVYRSRHAEPSWALFFDEMRARRDALLKVVSVDEPTLESDYRFVSIVDLLSLSFCNAWTEEHERFGCVARCRDGLLETAPSPFAEPTVPLRVRARRLPDRRYASAAELRAAFESAPIEILEGRAAVRSAA